MIPLYLYDKAIALCGKGGIANVLLRADTDFCLTIESDRWDATVAFGVLL